MLDYWLGLSYRALVHDRKSLADAARLVREAFEADQGLREEAELRVASITELMAKRDYVSRFQRDCLRAALAPENQ